MKFGNKFNPKKVINYSSYTLLVLILGLFFFPQLLFPIAVNYKTFTVYSRKPLDNKIYNLLDAVEDKLRTSEIYDSTMTHKIFFCKGIKDYSYFAPTSSSAFACNYPFVNNIFLSETNIKSDIIKRKGSESTRTISGTIVHEITHSLIEKKIGLIKYKLLTNWKNEGYSDFIANESSIIYSDGITQLCNDSLNHSYFKYRLMVEYLITNEHLSFDELISNKYDQQELMEIVKNKHCQSKK